MDGGIHCNLLCSCDFLKSATLLLITHRARKGKVSQSCPDGTINLSNSYDILLHAHRGPNSDISTLQENSDIKISTNQLIHMVY